MTDAVEDPAVQRQFEREKTIFEQNCEEFRSLNGFLWQIPVIVSTLTGGLWFGADKATSDSFVRPALWFLAFAVNAAFIIVLWRLRAYPMESLLDRIHAYQNAPRTGGRYTMIIVFSGLLLLSSIVSLVAFLKDANLIWKSLCGM